MSKKIIAIFIRGFHNGGIEKVFEQYLSHMDLTPFEIHIVTHMKNDPARKKVFTDMGCIIHELSPVHGHKLTKKNISEYKALFEKYKFDIVHNNMPDILLPLKYARKNGVPVRILHAHNDYTRGFNLKQKLMSPVYRLGYSINTSWANVLIGVSRQAAVSAFGKKADQAIILPNATELKRFAFSEDSRKKLRSKLNVNENELLFGHVGRYENDQKNQEFVLTVFSKYASNHDNARLVMLGDGKRRPEFEKMAADLGISSRVTFTGNVPNVADYLCAMDIYLFPSRKEGLGIAAVEAQTTGLYALISDTVPREALVTEDHAEFLPISGEDAADKWLEAIDRAVASLPARDRRASLEKAASKGYDINDQCQRLADIYKKS